MGIWENPTAAYIFVSSMETAHVVLTFLFFAKQMYGGVGRDVSNINHVA